MSAKYQWDRIQEQADSRENGWDSLTAFSVWAEIPINTLHYAIKRGDLKVKLTKVEPKVMSPEDINEQGKLVLKKIGYNDAQIRFESNEPISASDLIKVAGLDEKEWKIVDQEIGTWQVARAAKSVDLEWNDGRMTGTVNDEGGFNKERLYKISVKITRVNRVPVKVSGIQPVNIKLPPFPAAPESPPQDNGLYNTLFIGDPHFGYADEGYGALEPIHHRQFISNLLYLGQLYRPNEIGFAGDMMDFPDISSFDTRPAYQNNLQLAGMECAWVMGRARQLAEDEVWAVEGNHDERLRRQMIKHMTSLYGLKPVHELDGPPLMSVERFLGFANLNVTWVDGYPDGKKYILDTKFTHGNVVRNGSGKTVASLADAATVSHFFGHIHRQEVVRKWVADQEKHIWVGSTGAACRREFTPGAKSDTNWSLGALWITWKDGQIANVEPIAGDERTGDFIFRGNYIHAPSYLDEFRDSIPAGYRTRL